MAHPSAWQRWWLEQWPHRLSIRRHVPRFLRACPEPFRGRVLEVGAGTGWTSRTILETYPQVELTATDSDPRATDRFTRLQDHYGRRLHVQPADIYTLPFDRGAFDMVVAFHVINHLADVTTAIQHLMRVVRPGGLVGILDSVKRDPVTAALEAEATLLVNKGETVYYLWAQKAYPF